MGSQSPAHHQILSKLPEMARIVSGKQLHLGRDYTSDARYSDDASVQMARKGQIRSPQGVGVKVDRIM